MQRRTLIAGAACTLPLAGCITDLGEENNSNETDEGPENCPTSQDIGVEWPDELDASSVESFVEDYEQVYYKELVVEYTPETSLDSYEANGKVTTGPSEVGDGWELKYRGGGAVYRPTLMMGATPEESPSDIDPVPLEEISKNALVDMLQKAADTGEAELAVETPREEIKEYLELFESLDQDVQLSERGDTARLYVDVDGTTVKLSVSASNFHGDYDWEAWYYVDDQVVRRTSDEKTDPREGELLECREDN